MLAGWLCVCGFRFLASEDESSGHLSPVPLGSPATIQLLSSAAATCCGCAEWDPYTLRVAAPSTHCQHPQNCDLVSFKLNHVVIYVYGCISGRLFTVIFIYFKPFSGKYILII